MMITSRRSFKSSSKGQVPVRDPNVENASAGCVVPGHERCCSASRRRESGRVECAADVLERLDELRRLEGAGLDVDRVECRQLACDAVLLKLPAGDEHAALERTDGLVVVADRAL